MAWSRVSSSALRTFSLVFLCALMLIFFICCATAWAVACSCLAGTSLSRKPVFTAPCGSNISPLITERWNAALIGMTMRQLDTDMVHGHANLYFVQADAERTFDADY